MKSCFLIYFPSSGRAGDLDRNLGRIIRRLTEEGGYLVSSIVLSETEILSKSISEYKPDLVVAVGGDGTVRRVLESMYFSGTHIPVAIVPLGTGNLYAKSLGIVPTRGEDVIDTSLDIILGDYVGDLDLGMANGRIFAIDIGVGPIATAVIAPKPWQKARLKMLAYISPFLQSMRKKPATFKLTLDGNERVVTASGIFVTNEREMGLTSEPGDLSTMRDAKFEIYIFEPRSILGWLKIAWACAIGYYANSSVENPPYTRLVAHDNIVIESESPGYMVDGDRCAGSVVDIKVLPGAVRVAIPRWTDKLNKRSRKKAQAHSA